VPQSLYLDNGAAISSRQLLRACASLGIRLVHSQPYRPQRRGKIERCFRTVRDQFLVELEQRGCRDVVEFNRLFGAWVETVYHRTQHFETGMPPLERFLAGGPPALPTPAALREAFLWSEHRLVSKVATVSLHGTIYEVDPALVGERIELVFDPFDLSQVDVRFAGRPLGPAVPHRIGAHSPRWLVAPDQPPPPPRAGIDYLALVAERHQAATRRQIAYAAITDTEETPDDH
jgi:putative transposase